jgi:hypothetical protein
MDPLRTRLVLLLVAASAALGSCAENDRASVTIEYREPSGIPSLEPPTRQRIIAAFKAYASAKGYQCRPHPKRLEELTCRGPRDMHITFKPDLNRRSFVAQFNWLEVHGRTREEFQRHVGDFSSSMARAVKDADVRTH